MGEAGDVALGQLRHRREEAVVLRLVGDPAVEVDQQVGVVGPDRPDVAVRPSRSRTSASQWRGATCASASAAVTAEIYRPEVSRIAGRRRVSGAGVPQVQHPLALDDHVRVVEDDLVGGEPGTSCPGRGTPAPGRSPARRRARPRRPGRRPRPRTRHGPVAGVLAGAPYGVLDTVGAERVRRVGVALLPLRRPSRWVTTKTWSPTIGRPPQPSTKSKRWRPISWHRTSDEVEVVGRRPARRGRRGRG